ncbi:hypothetical protein GGF43_003717 [Coemansia sp. RSA 2618]|nr:hypothetical protein GGF43_003717 [Coemansia sp. RSA 2618]
MHLAGSRSGAAEVAVPEAAVHRGASLERTMSAGRGRGARRSSDCGSSSDDSSGDSDDTLTTKDLAASSDSAPAARTQSAGRVAPTMLGGSAMPGPADADCADAEPKSMPARVLDAALSVRTPFFLGSASGPPRARAAAGSAPTRLTRSAQADSMARSSQDAPAAAEGSRLLHSGTTVLAAPQQRRQQLSLGRLRSGAKTSILTSTVRSTLLNLSVGHNHRADVSTPRKPVTTVRFQKKRSTGAMSKLSLAPQPTLAEQARMDAWTADDDDFSVSEYDLSGVYFELPLMPTQMLPSASPTTKQAPSNMSPKKTHDSACTTPGSRLSSTSTVVDECTLSPEQYQRIYRCSAHKLQLPGRGRAMSSMVHVKNIMAKASDCYVVVSGGRHLDACQMPRDVFAGLYVHDSAAPAGDLLGDGPYPARSRSAVCMQQLWGRSRPDQSSQAAAVPARRRSLDNSCIGRAAAASGCELLYSGDLLGPNSGDLVSLNPAGMASGYDSASATVPTYRPYRRRRAGRRASGNFMSAFATVAAVTA